MAIPNVPEDVLSEIRSEFVEHVDAKAIARAAQSSGIIPQRVETDILGAKADDDANYILVKHLRSQATLEDLITLCSIMKDSKGCSKMISFGTKLQTKLEKAFPEHETASSDPSVVASTDCDSEEEERTLVHQREEHSSVKGITVANRLEEDGLGEVYCYQPMATSSSSASVEAQKVQVVERDLECETLHTLAEIFVTTFGRIVASLATAENAEKTLHGLKAAAVCKIALKGVPNPPSEVDVNDADSVRQLFCLLHIHRNWVDISLLEQMVTVSENKTAAAILEEYKKSHKSFISEAVARLVDPSTDGTCLRPDANSCILQLVFSDEEEGMLVKEILAKKKYVCKSFGFNLESLKFLSAVIGNSLVVTWLASRHIGLRAMDQCRSIPVLAALRKMQVLAIRLRYPGRLVSVKTDMNAEGRLLMEEAVRGGDLERVQELIRRGTDVNEGFIVDEVSHVHSSLLMVAVEEGHEGVAVELVRAGADIHVKDRDGCTALHRACGKGLEEVVEALITRGCPVEEEDGYSRTPLVLAAERGDTAILLLLVQAGASCAALSEDQMSLLFRHACHEAKDHLLVVRTLLKDGCSIGNLSKEEQEELLLQACRESDLVVEHLLAEGCNVNCVSFDGYTPLMVAAQNGQEEVVMKLILAGADLGMRNKLGNTALHYAALHNHINCGILLAEGGASVRVKNKCSETPLDLAKAEFMGAIVQALSFTIRKAICVIGNAESGKSTFIAAQQALEYSKPSLRKFLARFSGVEDKRRRTAGIDVIPHCSRRYGEVLFFDFAGPHEYHGPHQMFLESLLCKPGASVTFLLVIKMTEEEEAILHQLHRWLTPVALMSTIASPPQVIVIGSFLDKVRSKQEAVAKLTRCIGTTKRNLEELPLQFVGSCFLNCRQPQSEGIELLCSFLQEVPMPQIRATHTQYSLAWVLSQIGSLFKSPAVQLQDFSKWVQDNKDNLPRTMPPTEEVCQDLSAAGHALYLPNREGPSKRWLVLDLPSILHDVYGTLFRQAKEKVNEFGLLHYQHLAKLFPDLDTEMVQQLLNTLEFCIPVDPSVLRVDMSQLTQSEEASGWLFFPTLLSTKPSQPTLKDHPQHSVYHLCWQLKTSKIHSISACLLQTILLRLAAHFVVKHILSEGDQQHCCSMWTNGIAWPSTAGVDMTVSISTRVIQVLATSDSVECLRQYPTDVISDILSTVWRLSPRLAATAHMVHLPKMGLSFEKLEYLPTEMFPVESIRNSIVDHKAYACSLKDREDHINRMFITDLFGGYTPSLKDVEKFRWTPDTYKQSPSPTKPLQPEFHTPSKIVPSGDRALVSSSSLLDMSDIDKLVVTPVAAEWQRVALRLGVHSYVSEDILKNHPNDYEGACRDMFDRWLREEQHTGEEERTWYTLLTALVKAGFVDLERSLRREHKIQY